MAIGSRETTIKVKGDIKDFEKRMQDLINAGKQATDKLKGAGDGAANAFEKASGKAGLLEKNIGGINAAGVLTGVGIVKLGGIIQDTFAQAVNEASNYEKAIVGVNSVAKNMGQDTVKLNKYLQDLTKDGLLPFADAAAAVKNLLASGLSIEESISLLNSLKDAAAFNRQGQLSMGEAIVGATQGIKNQNSIMVDNAGITKNLSIMWKEYAVQIGKTVDELTDAEKAQAAFVGITKEAAVFQGDAAKAAQTYSGTVDKLETSYKRILIAGGQLITQSSLINRNMQALANTLENLAKPVDNSRTGRITQLRKEIDLLKASGSSAYGTIADLTRIVEKLEKEEETARKSRESLKGNDFTDEVIQNKNNREKIAIADKRARDAKAVEDLKAANEARKKNQEEYEKLLKQYEDFNVDRIKELENAQKRELKLAGNNEELKLSIRQNYAQKIFDFEQKNNDKLAKLRKAQDEYEEDLAKKAEERLKRRQELMDKATDNPFAYFESLKDKTLTDEDRNAIGLSAGAGALSQIANGREGARNLITEGAATGLDTLAPGLGQALKPLISGLTQGPEATRAFVREFAEGVPEIIQAFAESIPVLVEELANQTPVIIDRLIDSIPEITGAFVRATPTIISALAFQSPKIIAAMIKNVPSLIQSFIDGLRNGAGDFVKALIDAVNPFSSDSGVGGVFSDIGDFLGFAEGGQAVRKVPSGFSGDRFPAWLTENELVVKPSLTNKMERFFSEGGGANNARTDALLSAILQKINNPMTVSTSVEFNNKALADIILDLNRSNARLS